MAHASKGALLNIHYYNYYYYYLSSNPRLAVSVYIYLIFHLILITFGSHNSGRPTVAYNIELLMVGDTEGCFVNTTTHRLQLRSGI